MADLDPSGDLPLVLKLRLERGVPVAEVERQTGVNHKTIVSYENGSQLKPLAEPLKLLADYYEISVSDLYADFFRRRQLQPDAA